MSANALLVSLVAFIVGGSFIALSLNDLTWYTFALVAALDRLSVAHPVSRLAEHQPFIAGMAVSSTPNMSAPRSSAAQSLQPPSSFR